VILLKQPNAIEKKFDMSCANCAHLDICKLTTEKSLPEDWICEYYANEEKGVYAKANAKKRLS
jgi:hypothetical protein